MRNHSSIPQSSGRLVHLTFLAIAAFFLTAPVLRSQCSDAGANSSGCVSQPLAQPGGTLPGADHSTDASASNSLSSGSTYSEGATHVLASQRAAQSRVPEPPTEFQRFVTATTGEVLPVYGANLFQNESVTFGPIDHAPAPAELIVGADDELRVRLWGQVNFSANLRVSREGDIYLPRVGAVHVAGMPFSALSAHLHNALERVYRNFELSVDLGEIHSIQIYITGQARRPGEYTISALGTLVNAVFACGGPSAAGSMRHMLLKRLGKVVVDFDLYALLVAGDKTGDTQLQPDDVLYIPATGPQVALIGSVRQAGIYELRGEEPLGWVIDAAGGRTAIASGARLSIERIVDHARRRVFELTGDAAGLTARLADGDIVRVDPISSTYRETVTLRGSVASPGRFRWHAGMRLSELMPDRESLESRDYWWRRTGLGLPAPEFEPAQHDRPQASLPESEQAAPLAKAVADRPMEAQAAVLSPGAQTDWDYATIERLDSATMSTTLIPFDLGKLVLDHDAAQDLELEEGDVVTVFSQEDIHLPVNRLTKYVRLEGEFVHGGIYSVRPGETLRSLVARAGGLTDTAYLYGSEFTRKSTREIEQQRLNEYADQLEHQLGRNAIALTTVAAGVEDKGHQSQIASVDRDFVARLHQTHASGRVVLDLRPRSAGTGALPDIPLEDGDRLVVPSRPLTIQVVGAVPNQNAFLFRDSATVADYIRLAGRPNHDADIRRILILRADGSVTSRDVGQSIFASSSSFDRQRLYPGDTIVIPEKAWRPSGVREVMAWVQLFSELSLTGALVSSVK